MPQNKRNRQMSKKMKAYKGLPDPEEPPPTFVLLQWESDKSMTSVLSLTKLKDNLYNPVTEKKIEAEIFPESYLCVKHSGKLMFVNVLSIGSKSEINNIQKEWERDNKKKNEEEEEEEEEQEQEEDGTEIVSDSESEVLKMMVEKEMKKKDTKGKKSNVAEKGTSDEDNASESSSLNEFTPSMIVKIFGMLKRLSESVEVLKVESKLARSEAKLMKGRLDKIVCLLNKSGGFPNQTNKMDKKDTPLSEDEDVDQVSDVKVKQEEVSFKTVSKPPVVHHHQRSQGYTHLNKLYLPDSEVMRASDAKSLAYAWMNIVYTKLERTSGRCLPESKCGKERRPLSPMRLDFIKGTGKSRVLTGIAISVLVTHILNPKLKTPRVLICFPTYEALNSFTVNLEIIRKHLRSHYKKNAFECVVVGDDDKLDPAHKFLSLTSRVNCRIKRDAINKSYPETEEMMENDEQILQALINAKKHALFYVKNKNKYQGYDLECQVDEMEEKLRFIKVGLGDKIEPAVTSVRYKESIDYHKKEVLQRSEIILTTFSAIATTPMMTQLFNISYYAQTSICLIDDAHQASEIKSLMPLVCGAQKIVLAGDLNLPLDTPRSACAGALGLSNSLMLRVSRAVSAERSYEKAYDMKEIPYYKLKVQHRLPSNIVRLAVQCLKVTSKICYSNSNPAKYWPREFLIFDHDYPLAHSPTLQNRNITSDKRDEMLNKEARLASQVFYGVVQQLLRFKKDLPHYKVMLIVPDKEYKERLRRFIPRDSNPENCTSFICTLDTCSSLEANVVILCLGDEISKFKNAKVLTLALSRTINSCFVVGHLDYFKNIPHWLIILKKSEKYQARVSVHTNTTPEMIKEQIFRSETLPLSKLSLSCKI